MKKYNLSLSVNGKPIELTGFPKDFLPQTLAGAASSLKGVEEIDNLELTLKFGKIKMAINQENIPLGPFPTLILARTLTGMLSPLKGVDGEVVTVEAKMKVSSTAL